LDKLGRTVDSSFAHLADFQCCQDDAMTGAAANSELVTSAVRTALTCQCNRGGEFRLVPSGRPSAVRGRG
jgi:hypothetical protein